MSICPWCKGNNPRAYDVCPLCGKIPHEHPSIAGSGFASLEAFDDFDEPGDMDLSPEAGPIGVDVPGAFGGEAFEAGSGGLSLELDAPVRQVARPRIQSQGLPSQGVPSHSPAPLASSGPPSSSTAHEAPRFDAYEIALLADFGPIPEKVWEFPMYAVRVHNRKRELKRRLAMAKVAVADGERKRNDCLATLAEQARPQLEASRELSSLLEPLRQIEETAATRQEALSARNQELDEKVSVVDREIEGLRGVESSAKAQVDEAAQIFDGARRSLDRAKAQVKKVEIELRNVQEVARAAAGPQARTALPEHAEKIHSLTAILEESRQAVAGPQAAFDQTQRQWNASDGAYRAVQKQISDLEKQRRTIVQSFSKELGVRSQGIEQAQEQRREALVTVGARLMELQAPLVPESSRERFYQMQDSLEAQLREAEKLEDAIGSDDREAVKKGWMVWVGAGVLLLLVLVLMVVFLGRSEPEPEPVFSHLFVDSAH